MTEVVSELDLLRRITTPEDTIAVVALDQRNTIRKMFAKIGREQVSDQEMVAFKSDIMAALNGVASGFLVDPDYGMPAARLLDERPRTLLAAEPASRGSHHGEPVTALDPDQDARWAIDQGADALKFFSQMRADRPVDDGGRDLTAEAVDAVRTCVADCREAGIASVIENLIYPLRGEDELTPEHRADVIIESAALLDDLQPSILKLEYPGSPAACRRLADRLTRPWAVLSAGVPMDQFSEVLKISCDEGGASGFIAGRAIWADSMTRPDDQRRAYLSDVGRRRLDECRSVIEGRARPLGEASLRKGEQ